MAGIRHKLRMAGALVASLAPTSRLRRLIYTTVLGYEIAPTARLGFLTVIAVDRAKLGDGVRLGRFSRISGPMRFEAGAGARMGPSNVITCGEHMAHRMRDPHVTLGARSLVTVGHFIDGSGGFALGSDSWIAGRASQFWTHGAGQVAGISIGARSYVGSATRMAAGSSVADDCVVAMGSVVTSQLDRMRCLVGGVPARVLREDIDEIWPEGMHARPPTTHD
jgi:acetyltransferase-like isoleucine patch superfamily enzyme